MTNKTCLQSYVFKPRLSAEWYLCNKKLFFLLQTLFEHNFCWSAYSRWGWVLLDLCSLQRGTISLQRGKIPNNFHFHLYWNHPHWCLNNFHFPSKFHFHLPWKRMSKGVVVVIFYLSDMEEDCLHIVTFYKSWSAQLTPRAIDGLKLTGWSNWSTGWGKKTTQIRHTVSDRMITTSKS